ncbi:ankyrin repeat and SOCS box protein 2-like isoform X1 [Pungitius pungitius]|uniref:ankyrin repeat and SOCS box protein 2-like isoform X1 n=1 Tax=Pungitius pungitius TaxID=134920 RepID=UPI002E11D251
MMAVSEVNLDDYSVYSHLTDEELLQIAVERSLCEKLHPGHVELIGSNPDQRRPDPLRHVTYDPSSQPHLLDPACVHQCVKPPNSLSQFLYEAPRSQLSPLQCLILNGDAAALMSLVRQSFGGLMEPDNEGWIALHEAAFYGQLQCLTILIKAYPDSVNRRTLKSQTALLLAAGRGNVSCVDFLLKNGANPNIYNKEGETPLFAACEQPSEDIVELLLRSGAQVNRCSLQGTSPLHEACRHGQLKLCRLLLEAGGHLHIKNIYGIQSFFIAAQHGHTDIIELLAGEGADINEQAGDGASPLFEACKNGHVSGVNALLVLKADANRPMKSGLLPLHVAIQNKHSRIVSLLIPVTSRVRIQHSGISPLHVAAENNSNDIMELLIKSGFDVNRKLSKDRSKMYKDRRSTPLYFSVYNDNLQATKMLLDAGADPNLDVFNALLIAVQLGRMDMAVLLLKYGANVNAQVSPQLSWFPVALLLKMESLPMLKLLLDNGCDARPCFNCPYGQKSHPAPSPALLPIEEMRHSREAPPSSCLQFCEAVSCSSLCLAAGPIISLLLDYVSHVCLCSRLLEVLESRSDWMDIKLKALPPHPLMQLCRLEIRRLVGVQRLKLICTLPLPTRLIGFLNHNTTPQSPEVPCFEIDATQSDL